jgi:hypothetical protein
MNKQQYLELRAVWKASYAELTQYIRATKAARTEAARAWSKNGYVFYTHNMSPEDLVRYRESNRLADAFLEMHRLREQLRMRANEKLIELSTLKAAAQAAYFASKVQA